VHSTRWRTLFLVPMLLVVPALSQDTSASKDTLYATALAAGVAQMQKQWRYIDDGDQGSRIRTDYQHLIVRKNPEITDDLPSESDDVHFEYLDDPSLLARYGKLKKSFSILEVHPIHDNGSTLRVHISENWVESHNGRLWIAISDWASVEFRYDCEQHAFVVSDVKLGGI
jgi:hypothetical protein